MAELNRRDALVFLGGVAVAAVAACQPPLPPRLALARLLGLTGPEEQWLDRLKDEQIPELVAMLSNPARLTPETIDLITRVLMPRANALAFAGYGDYANHSSVCDGLLRENG